MAEIDTVPFDAPIPGESLTAELGSRPWQSPPQFATVEQALDYYIPRLQSDEVSKQLLDVLEMGIPVTTVANSMQIGAVMEGKHSVDIGMLILPVLVELIMLIGDTAGVKYTSGLEKDSDIRSSVVDLAVKRFKDDDTEEEDTSGAETTIEEMKKAADERATGLMSRRMQ
tara:strand:+ start:551 stop:1060 length:510 start_codon:yes stop_codon:yes gene_type:complete